MCDICEKEKDIAEIVWMVIRGDMLVIEYCAYSADSDFEENIKINYCPFCGRNLRQVDMEE